MNLSRLDLTALSVALDDPDPDREHWLDRSSGALWTFVYSEATDETRRQYDTVAAPGTDWLRLPSPSPREAYEDAEDFVDSLEGEDLRDSLFDALERRGSLKDFRERLMEHPEVRARWLAVHRQRSRERLEGFLRSLGVEIDASIPEVAS